MSAFNPFETLVVGDVEATLSRDIRGDLSAEPPVLVGAVTASFQGFDLDERVIVADMPGLPPGELVRARSTVTLSPSQKGSTVVVLCERGNPRLPIVVGVLEDQRPDHIGRSTEPAVSSERIVLAAERELVLRCGDASITITRAGKVLIQGNYIVSRSRGCNKIKGAAIDIN